MFARRVDVLRCIDRRRADVRLAEHLVISRAQVAMVFPQSIAPMAPMLTKPFHRDRWVYEEKHDGWRMIAYKNGAAVRLVSRNGVATPPR
jgi:ATP-dependent DNA ligase